VSDDSVKWDDCCDDCADQDECDILVVRCEQAKGKPCEHCRPCEYFRKQYFKSMDTLPKKISTQG